MASPSSFPSHSSPRQKPFVICLLLVSLFILLSVLSVKPKKAPIFTRILEEDKRKSVWLHLVAKAINSSNTKIKIGLVNIDDAVLHQQLALYPLAETVSIRLDRVDDKKLKWEDFFPEWIDEDRKRAPPRCPDIPMPESENYRDLDVVVARVPCGKNIGTEKQVSRDLFRLQINLAVANLAVESGRMEFDSHRTVYVVFIGSRGPMAEIFRCDDLLMHQGEYWVYKPQLEKLKQKTLMPVGSCQIASAYAETGKEKWRSYMSQSTLEKLNYTTPIPKVAYVTVLHSSETYVCGAIALAQSIRQTNSTKDLLLLADNSIGPKSIKALKAAGWKIKRIQRILNPYAQKHAYNKWNYTKLRIWQLTRYDKVVFIDADLIILKNIDHLFFYPQLSAAPNDNTLFNSGLMVIEPSMCMFEDLMVKAFKVKSYNGGDQGLLNEIFAWWHRMPSRLNYLKIFQRPEIVDQHENMPRELYGIHYLGLKPWMCYKDYDCNWDMKGRRIFASDSAHARWWQVYEGLPEELQSHCGLTRNMDARLRKWRRWARHANLSDGHWRIQVQDPRRNHYVEENIIVN
ncbi:hypothetical protein L6164_035043 [Bauhinia variegata]|uniref:Uncharacterized protein n=1 Tax=Bauhinia variegata TaxID=167791 RepID=A0ACB9KXC9_BAUVA|nr:hypothetical protein L6164_035043 [Bauhinia variegata]